MVVADFLGGSGVTAAVANRPNLLDHSTKVLDMPLVNKIVYQTMPNLPDGVSRVVVHYVDIDDAKAVQTYIDEAPTDITVDLRGLKAVLDDVVLNDEVDYAVAEAEGQWTLTVERFRSDRPMQKIDDYNARRGDAKRGVVRAGTADGGSIKTRSTLQENHTGGPASFYDPQDRPTGIDQGGPE